MRKLFLSLPILFAFIMVLSGCGKTAADPTPIELLTKTWSVDIAKHDGTQVYKKGATSNVDAGYSNYKLALSGTGANLISSLTARDNTTFTGTWSLSSDNKTLTLSGLKNSAGQAPTGTTGTIVYNISGAVAASTVTLVSAAKDLKAGNSTVEIQLVNP
jgi:PBP1b-binding outer membrane lipoprotein LpoB